MERGWSSTRNIAMAHPSPPYNSEADWYRSDLPPILRPHRPAPFASMAMVALVLFIGALLGISSAYLVIEREQPFQAVTVGAWEAYPKAGTAEADPYSVAIYTRGTVIPLASGEGLALVARNDSSGGLLDPTCQYRIHGQTPTARLWTLTATDGQGRLVDTFTGRSNLISRQLLWQADGTFSVTAAQTPHSGNWLPIGHESGPADGLQFVLRLYDAPVTTGAALGGSTMPDIERIGCP